MTHSVSSSSGHRAHGGSAGGRPNPVNCLHAWVSHQRLNLDLGKPHNPANIGTCGTVADRPSMGHSAMTLGTTNNQSIYSGNENEMIVHKIFLKNSLQITLLVLISVSACQVFGDDNNKLEVEGPCNYTPITQLVQNEEDLYGSWSLEYSTDPAGSNGCEIFDDRFEQQLLFMNNGIVETRNTQGGGWESQSEYTIELISGCGYLSFTSSIDSLIVDSSPCDGGKLLYLRDSQ